MLPVRAGNIALRCSVRAVEVRLFLATTIIFVVAAALEPARAADATAATAADTPKYILFLTADGFRTEYIERMRPPHLSALIAEGVRISEVNNVFPTVTTPNMASLVTG